MKLYTCLNKNRHMKNSQKHLFIIHMEYKVLYYNIRNTQNKPKMDRYAMIQQFLTPYPSLQTPAQLLLPQGLRILISSTRSPVVVVTFVHSITPMAWNWPSSGIPQREADNKPITRAITVVLRNTSYGI